MLRRPIVWFATATSLVLWSAVALAQGAAPSPVDSLSTPLVVIALLGLVSAYVSQAVNTGSILGLKTVPVPALPYLTVLGTFLATLVKQLAGASPLTGTAVFNAVVFSLFMLAAPATGVGLHTHFATPGATARARALAASAAKAASFALLLVGIAATQTGCVGSPVWTQIVKTVLTDLENGVALSAIEQAVEAIDPAIAGDVAAADAVIQAVIGFLQTVGAIPPTAQPAALAMQKQLADKIAAAKKLGWVLSPGAGKLVAEFDAAQTGSPLSARGARVAGAVAKSFQ